MTKADAKLPAAAAKDLPLTYLCEWRAPEDIHDAEKLCRPSIPPEYAPLWKKLLALPLVRIPIYERRRRAHGAPGRWPISGPVGGRGAPQTTEIPRPRRFCEPGPRAADHAYTVTLRGGRCELVGRLGRNLQQDEVAAELGIDLAEYQRLLGEINDAGFARLELSEVGQPTAVEQSPESITQRRELVECVSYRPLIYCRSV